MKFFTFEVLVEDSFDVIEVFVEVDLGLDGVLNLSMEALEKSGAPQLIRKADGKPLMLAHKGEGVAVLCKDFVFVIHDDDRVLGRTKITNPETQFSRKEHQAAFTVVRLR